MFSVSGTILRASSTVKPKVKAIFGEESASIAIVFKPRSTKPLATCALAIEVFADVPFSRNCNFYNIMATKANLGINLRFPKNLKHVRRKEAKQKRRKTKKRLLFLESRLNYNFWLLHQRGEALLSAVLLQDRQFRHFILPYIRFGKDEVSQESLSLVRAYKHS